MILEPATSTSFTTTSAAACGSRANAPNRNQNRRRGVLPRREPDERCSREGLPAFAVVDVECHAGYRGEETPRRFRLAERQVEIAEVVDTWLAPDYRYFKVRDTQGDLYILRNDVAADGWDLVPSPSGWWPSPRRPNPDDPR